MRPAGHRRPCVVLNVLAVTPMRDAPQLAVGFACARDHRAVPSLPGTFVLCRPPSVYTTAEATSVRVAVGLFTVTAPEGLGQQSAWG